MVKNEKKKKSHVNIIQVDRKITSKRKREEKKLFNLTVQ